MLQNIWNIFVLQNILQPTSQLTGDQFNQKHFQACFWNLFPENLIRLLYLWEILIQKVKENNTSCKHLLSQQLSNLRAQKYAQHGLQRKMQAFKKLDQDS